LKEINDNIERNIEQEHDAGWKRDQAEMGRDAVDDRKEREDAAKAEARRKAEEAKQRFQELSE
jgi:methylase of polypeptide subunit release factors